MNLCKDSTVPSTVIQAVNEAFKQDQRGSFKWFNTNAAQETLTDRMFKIAMDNRLCGSDFQSIQGQSGLLLLITAKDSLSEQINTAQLANKKEWTD